MANDEGLVRKAIQQPPMLHRFVETMPRWLVLAARRVMGEYQGDAGVIWRDEPTADVLQKRFDKFTGIGQKKAAMAVEILERDLGVPIRDMHRSDIAYDVHIRRVFLRTRLAERDDRDHMIAVARALHRERPGELDMPTWLIGRGWCHPGIPNCATCPLTEVCPKDIERASVVTST
jgi:endonuclease III